MKSTIIILTSIFTFTFYSLAIGQININWQNDSLKFNINNIKASQLSDSTIILGQGDILVKLSQEGDSINKIGFNPDFRLAKNFAAIEGFFFVAGQENSRAALAKYDNDLNFISKVELGTGFGMASAFLIDGDDYYVSGSTSIDFSNAVFVMKFDEDLDTLWSIILPQITGADLTTIIRLNSGDFVASGNLDDYPLVLKFDADGDTVWTYHETEFISFNQSSVYEKNNGNILILNGGHLTELDGSGNVISNELMNKHSYNKIIEQNDTLYLMGTYFPEKFSQLRYPLIELRTSNFDSITSYVDSSNIHGTFLHQFSDGMNLMGGGILAVGTYRDSVGNANNRTSLIAMKFNFKEAPSSIGENGLPTSIRAFPNPCKHHLTIENTKKQNIQIFSISGKLIETLQTSSDLHQISTSEWPIGLYFLRTHKGEVHRIVKY